MSRGDLSGRGEAMSFRSCFLPAMSVNVLFTWRGVIDGSGSYCRGVTAVVECFNQPKWFVNK